MGVSGGNFPTSVGETLLRGARGGFRPLSRPLRTGAPLRGEGLRRGGTRRRGVPGRRLDDAEGGPGDQAQRQQRARQVGRSEAAFGGGLQEGRGGREPRVLRPEEPLDALQGGLGREAESGVSRPPESAPPFAWDETLPETMVNWTSEAPEPAPPACHGGEDCPPWSFCEEDHVGRQICRCGLGYHLHPVFGCVPVKVFAARLMVCNLEPPESSSLLVARQVQRLFQCLLGHLDGYLDSLIHALNRSGQEVTILHHFSAWGPVTSYKVDAAVDSFRAQCYNSSLQGTPFCDHAGAYKALNLCQLNVCDPFSTTCSSPDGLVSCTCHPGFFRAHAMDRTCTACESGFWLQNGTCIRCPFGFGGAACQEPLLLALVGVSCFAGLLLWLLLALLLFRRAPPAQETPVALPLPLRSRVLSLPRVRPPGSVPELEDCPPLALDPEREGLPAEGAPRMKTFLGSRGPPPSAPQTVRGCSNLVFIGDAGEPAKQDHF